MGGDLSCRFQQLLDGNLPKTEPIVFDAAIAGKLFDHIDGIRLHAHTYSLLHNLTHGSLKPASFLEFAYQNELRGLNIHVEDGGEHSLAHSLPKQFAQIKDYAQRLNLALHLETSSTQAADIDKVIQVARTLDVQNIRVYSRYEGTLSQVMARTVADLLYMAEQADRYDLSFDFEQHEEFKSAEIVQMLNAYEQPLPAFKTMAPYIRQVHLKGAIIIKEGQGYRQVGVVQSSVEDEMPYARMLYELLMLGEKKPQVICFALEQEVNYYAPAYRRADEGGNPFIPYKDPSETPFDEADTDMVLLNERRWASNQVNFIRSLLAELRWMAIQYLDN